MLHLSGKNFSFLKPSHRVFIDSITSNNFIIYNVNSVFPFLFFLIVIVSHRLSLDLFINIHKFLLLNSSEDFSALPHWSKCIFWFTRNNFLNLEAMSFILQKNIVRSCSEIPSLVTNIWKEVSYYLVWILITYGFQASCESVTK